MCLRAQLLAFVCAQACLPLRSAACAFECAGVTVAVVDRCAPVGKTLHPQRRTHASELGCKVTKQCQLSDGVSSSAWRCETGRASARSEATQCSSPGSRRGAQRCPDAERADCFAQSDPSTAEVRPRDLSRYFHSELTTRLHDIAGLAFIAVRKCEKTHPVSACACPGWWWLLPSKRRLPQPPPHQPMMRCVFESA